MDTRKEISKAKPVEFFLRCAGYNKDLLARNYAYSLQAWGRSPVA